MNTVQGRSEAVDVPSYEQLLAAQKRCDEKNDCAVWAVAVVTASSYEQARAALAAEGRKARRATPWAATRRAILRLGYTPVEVRWLFSGKTVVTVTRELERQWKHKRVLMDMHAHVAGWNGHRVVDWSEGRRNRVYGLWYVIKTPRF